MEHYTCNKDQGAQAITVGMHGYCETLDQNLSFCKIFWVQLACIIQMSASKEVIANHVCPVISGYKGCNTSSQTHSVPGPLSQV